MNRVLDNRVTRYLVKNGVNLAMHHPQGQRAICSAYRTASYAGKAFVHRNCAKLFREGSTRVVETVWVDSFAGKDIRCPIRNSTLWLDWDIALSLTGHDVEIKATYESLLRSCYKPDLFIDIGANYGTHSLLFLCHGVRSISFEPNASCIDYYGHLCDANGVKGGVKAVALGESIGNVNIRFPVRETWLGTIEQDVAADLVENDYKLVSESVPLRTLDSYLSELQGSRLLLKIDTEGSEVQVLRGALEVLKRMRPKVIFESWQGDGREILMSLFVLSEYEIFVLPWLPGIGARALTPEQFRLVQSTNFIAIPKQEHLGGGAMRRSIGGGAQSKLSLR